MGQRISEVTVVSALYYIGRDKWKHSGFGIGNDAYKNWVKNLLSLDCNLYFFVDDYYHDYILEHRKKYDPNLEKTVIHNIPLHDLEFYKTYHSGLSCVMSSPEFRSKVTYATSAEVNYCLYNIINFNKIEFIKKSKDENKFNSDYFFWADAGGMRENITNYENKKWPIVSTEYFNDKIIHFSHTDNLVINGDKSQYFMSQNRRIQGTAWIVPKNMVDTYYNLIHNEIANIVKEGIVGSDEKVYDFLYVNNKELFELKKCGWFEYYKMCSVGTNKMVKIYTVAYSKPEFITLQYAQLKKHCKDDFELIIINNAKDDVIDKEISEICKIYNLQMISSPRDHKIANVSHFTAINFALDNYAKKDNNVDITVIIDNDVFPFKDFTFNNLLGNSEVGAVYQQRQDETIEYLHPIFSMISNKVDMSTLDYTWKTYTDCGGRTDDFIKQFNLKPNWIKHTAAIDIETDYIFTQNNQVQFPYKKEYRSQIIGGCMFHYYRGDNWDEQRPEYHTEKFKFLLYFLNNWEKYGLNLDDRVHYEKAHAEKGWEGKDFNYRNYRFVFNNPNPNESNVFLDLGCHDCQGLQDFVRNILPIDNAWEIHTFEPNMLMNPESCVKNTFGENFNITVHRQAVWIRNGKTIFGQYGHDGTSQGSLIMETGGSKNYQDYFSQHEVECVDFLEFVNQFKDKDNVFIKMDIEWSEYQILRDMLDRGWPKNIKKIWVEFHGTYDPTVRQMRDGILRQVRETTQTTIEDWH